MKKVAAQILMDMFEKTNAESIADAVWRPSQVKLLTLLCRKARAGETAHRAAHSLSPAFSCGLRQTERIRRTRPQEEHLDSSESKLSTAREFRSFDKSFRYRMKQCTSPASHRFL